MSDTRRVHPALAALANLVGIGLGYVYLGRLRYAFALLGVAVGVLAIAGWSRLVFVPDAIVFLAVTAALIGLFPIVHCAVMAVRVPERAAVAYNRWWFYGLWILVSWFLTDVIVATRPTLFGFEPFRLPAASMAPTLDRGDFIMADTWHYDREQPQYGDLVVFSVPGQADIHYVKRIIGLPGDRIELRDDVLIRNGGSIKEHYLLLSSRRSNAMRNFGPAEVPDEHYFVLGDNRHNSRDSRFFGSVGRKFLHGRVVHRWFSYDDGVRWDRFPEHVGEN